MILNIVHDVYLIVEGPKSPGRSVVPKYLDPWTLIIVRSLALQIRRITYDCMCPASDACVTCRRVHVLGFVCTGR